jgi:CRISPR/Cas system-associated endonuclease Cas3-HD
LLHDIGKPASQKIIDSAIHFYGHEDVGGKIAEAILRRLKFDASTIKKVTTMVKNHMRPYDLVNASEKALRKFIRNIGEELVESVLDLADADEKGSFPAQNQVSKVRERIKKIKESPIKVRNKPVLDGNEIMNILNISSNDKKRLPEIGLAGKFLLELADEYAEQGKELTKEEAAQQLLKAVKNN